MAKPIYAELSAKVQQKLEFSKELGRVNIYSTEKGEFILTINQHVISKAWNSKLNPNKLSLLEMSSQ